MATDPREPELALDDPNVTRGVALRFQQSPAERSAVPRKALAVHRADGRDAVALLEASNAGRIPALVPVRYGRMLASPFAFYRGAAPLMAYDLSLSPRTRLAVQLSGDCHLMNFGLFASPERELLFGMNDFDETLPGPFEWDLKRLAASFVIACRDRGFAERVGRECVRTMAATYRARLAEFAQMDALAVWYYRITADMLFGLADSRATRAKVRRVIARAQGRTSEAMLDQATEVVDGRLRIKDSPPLVYHFTPTHPSHRTQAELEGEIRELFRAYRDTLPDDRRALIDRYVLQDVAVKVVGVGSVGTRCAVALMLSQGRHPLFLQFKEARASCLEPYLGASAYAQHGERVVCGQRLIQAATDIFLGWTRWPRYGADFYVRQLRDMKGGVRPERMEPQDFEDYAEACGWALARAQAKSGDAAMLAGYIGKGDALDRALEDYAAAYAEQNERDWAALKQAVRSGRVQAIMQ